MNAKLDIERSIYFVLRCPSVGCLFHIRQKECTKILFLITLPNFKV